MTYNVFSGTLNPTQSTAPPCPELSPLKPVVEQTVNCDVIDTGVETLRTGDRKAALNTSY